MTERNWTGLGEAQADGQACVICGRDFRVRGSVSVPVGRSHTGSQVFACDGECAAAATRGKVAPPVWVVYDDMADLLPCGCPESIVADEGHQSGCGLDVERGAR